MSWDFLAGTIDFVLDAHQNHPRKPEEAWRRWDGRTPMSLHPIWCAASIATEERLSERDRQLGAQVLLLHDVLEDTTCELPPDVPEEVRRLVVEMTVERGTNERIDVWSKGDFIILLKLFDKVNNCLNVSGSRPGPRREYAEYTMRLCEHVEGTFGDLNITRLARAICAPYLR